MLSFSHLHTPNLVQCDSTRAVQQKLFECSGLDTVNYRAKRKPLRYSCQLTQGDSRGFQHNSEVFIFVATSFNQLLTVKYYFCMCAHISFMSSGGHIN